MADDDKVRPMTDDEFDFYRKNGRLPTPQETGAQAQKTAAAENARQTGGGAGQTAEAAGRGLRKYAQTLGIPTTWQEAKETITPSFVQGRYPLYEMGRELGRHLYEGGKEAYEAGRNIAGGQPVLPNIAKGAYGLYHAGVEGLPVIGGQMEDVSKNVLQKKYPEAAGGAAGIAKEFLLPKAAERVAETRAARRPTPRALPPVEGPERPPYGPQLPPYGAGAGAAAGEPLPRIPGPAGGGGAVGPGPGAPGTIPPARPVPRRPRPGPVQGPKLPTAEEQLNVPSQQMFGKNYADLLPDQKRAAASRLGGPAGEQQTTLPTITPEAAERRVRDVGPAPGELDQRAVNRDIQTLMANNPMRANLLDNTFRQWQKATGPEKQVLADRIRGMQAELQPHPEVAGKTAEPSIFKPGETITGMKPEELKSKEEAEAAQAARTAGRQARFGGQTPTPPLPTAATPSPGAAGAAPGVSGATMPTVRPLPRSVEVGPSTSTLPPAPEATTLPPTRPAGESVPQGTVPAISLDEALRRATGQPEPVKPKPGVPLGEQLGKE